MKTLILLLFISLSTAFADTNNFEIKSVWKAKMPLSSKTYLAVIRDKDNIYNGDKVILFGKKQESIKVRYFSLFSLNFYSSTGSTFESQDEYYFLKGNVVRKDKILKISLTNPMGDTSNIVFEKNYSEQSKLFAKNAISVIAQRLQETDDLNSPQLLYQFKRMMMRVRDRMGYFLVDDELEYDLPVYPLQIEQNWPSTNVSEEIKETELRMDGNDLISKKFREATSWSDESTVPDFGNKKYSYFSKVTKGFKTKALLNGADLFVKYEITNVDFFECGDYIREKVKSYVWVLNDGSTFGYSPYLECD
jgi:hypothetical protein